MTRSLVCLALVALTACAPGRQPPETTGAGDTACKTLQALPSARTKVGTGHAAGYVRRLEALLRATRARQRQGTARQTDLAQVRARLAEARAELAAAKGNAATSVAALRRVVGDGACTE